MREVISLGGVAGKRLSVKPGLNIRCQVYHKDTGGCCLPAGRRPSTILLLFRNRIDLLFLFRIIVGLHLPIASVIPLSLIVTVHAITPMIDSLHPIVIIAIIAAIAIIRITIHLHVPIGNDLALTGILLFMGMPGIWPGGGTVASYMSSGLEGWAGLRVLRPG